MNAQTVVDTFAPFVGTEGLRGIRNLKLSECESAVKFYRHPHGMTILPPDLAHGFLLSRLAEGLGRRGWVFRFVEDAPSTDTWWNAIRGDFDHSISGCPNYPSAILAAARVEWPSKTTTLRHESTDGDSDKETVVRMRGPVTLRSGDSEFVLPGGEEYVVMRVNVSSVP